MSRELALFGMVMLFFGVIASLSFFSLYNKVQQEQAELELSVAEMNKNRVKMQLQVKERLLQIDDQ